MCSFEFKKIMEFRVIVIFVLVSSAISEAEDNSKEDLVAVLSECSNQFPLSVSSEVLFYSHRNPNNVLEGLKDDHTAKCMIHCFYSKTGVANANGTITTKKPLRKFSAVSGTQELITVTDELEYYATVDIEKCYAQEDIATENDACEKFYKILVCASKEKFPQTPKPET